MKSKIKLKNILKAGLIIPMMSLVMFTAHAQEKGKPWPAPESAIKIKNPQAANAENLAEGKTLYTKHCKSCHGTKGKGDGTKAANLEILSGDFSTAEFQNKSEGEMYWKTTEGRDPMPEFKKKISDEERWNIVLYVRTLGQK